MGRALHCYSKDTNVNVNGDESQLVGAGSSTTEADNDMSWRHAGTFSLLGRNCGVSSGVSNLIRLRVAGANGTNVADGGGTGWVQDLTNRDTIAANTLVNYTYGTSGGFNATYGATVISFEASSGHVSYAGAGRVTGFVYDVASSTRFLRFAGELVADGETVEANCQLRNKTGTRLSGMQVNVLGNARLNDTVIRSRINGVDGNQVITIPAGGTGLFIDTSNTDTIAANDLYCASITTGTGIEDLTINFVAVGVENASTHQNELALRSGIAARGASATEHFLPLGGHWNPTRTVTYISLKPGFNGTVSNLQCYISANTYTGSFDLNVQLNGVDALTLTVAAGQTGWKENTGSFVFAPTDELRLSIVGGTSGSITIQQMMTTITDLTPSIPVPPPGKGKGGKGTGGGPKKDKTTFAGMPVDRILGQTALTLNADHRRRTAPIGAIAVSIEDDGDIAADPGWQRRGGPRKPKPYPLSWPPTEWAVPPTIKADEDDDQFISVEDAEALYEEAIEHVPERLQAGLVPAEVVRGSRAVLALPPSRDIDFQAFARSLETIRVLVAAVEAARIAEADAIRAFEEKTRKRRREEETLLIQLIGELD